LAIITSISGIRGTIGGRVGESLSPVDVVKYSAAYGTWINRYASSDSQKPKVIIGRDARISGEMVAQFVVGTLQSLGIDVVDLGMATTPTVEMAVMFEQANGGIILSASHNPKHWNALKLLNGKGEFISAADGNIILKLAKDDDFTFSEVTDLGSYRKDDSYLQKHIDAILALDLVDVEAIKKRDFKIVVDGINSVGSFAVPAMLEALGVQEIVVINGEANGHFAHNPEPLPQNLATVSNAVKREEADLAFVVDPDVDRLAIVCENGDMFGEEYTLVAVADYILQHKQGNTVSNLSSTRALGDITKKRCKKHKYYSSAVGEVNVVAKMKAVDAVIGGEGNGGIIVPELHYGRDALVGIALFLSHLARFGRSCTLLRSRYPDYTIVKNKIELTPEIDVDAILQQLKQKYKRYPMSTIDGVRIEFDGDWVHLRRSNTEPIIRIYAESSTEAMANAMVKRIQENIKEFI